MFDWDDLRYFLAVARQGSTLAAAKTIGVSQPTVARRLSALEERLERKLVEQHPTGYRLTDFGRALLPYAEEVERSVTAFQRQAISGGKDLSGTIRVTCPEGMASRLLAPMIEAFQVKYPQLRVDLIMTDRRLDLYKGEAEVVVRMHEPGDASLIARRIADSAWGFMRAAPTSSAMGVPRGMRTWTVTLLSNSPARWPTIKRGGGFGKPHLERGSRRAAIRCAACWPS